jgi:hypothetical protein
MELEAFTALVRDAMADWGGRRVVGRVRRSVFAALTSTEGVVITHRRGMLRRCAGELGDLQRVLYQVNRGCARGRSGADGLPSRVRPHGTDRPAFNSRAGRCCRSKPGGGEA